MKNAFFIFTLFLSAYAHADESDRQAKIAQIIESQGLQQMFQQQLDQSKVTASELGKSLYRKMLAESGIPEGQGNSKVEKVFTEYLDRCASMFSSKELVSTWSRFYGKDISEADLDKILAFYNSPAGKKDVMASQIAMAGFSQAMAVETQNRMNVSIGKLMADLRSAMANLPKEPL